MEPVNVLYVEENQDGTTGGSHVCMLDLVRSLDRSKITPRVMFYEDNRFVDDFLKENVQVSLFRKPRPLNLVKRLDGKPFSVLRFFPKLLQVIINVIVTDLFPLIYFIYYISKYKIDIIHLNNTVFAGLLWTIAGKVTKRKIVVHERTRLSSIASINRFHHKFVDYILGTSKSTELYLREHNVDLSKYSTFYDRVDVELFRSKKVKSKKVTRELFKIEQGQPCVGIVGNLQRWKGQMTVVDAISVLVERYPDIRCLLIGDCSKETSDDVLYFKEIEHKLVQQDLEENIHITGYRSDIPDLLNALDVFIHASISPEPYGLVVLEAMAMEKAIIASGEGGPAEMLVHGESGLLIEPGNHEVLADSIDFLLSDRTKRKAFGSSAYKRVCEKFSSLDIAFIEKLYVDLLNSP